MEPNIELDGSGFSEEEFLDVKICLETLFSIRSGSQPLDRDLGIDLDGIVGYPLDVAKNMLSLEIMDKVARYEPRVDITEIDFYGNTDGQLRPRIYFIKAEG